MRRLGKKMLLFLLLGTAFCMLTGFAPSKMLVNSKAIVRQEPTIKGARIGTLEAGEVVRVTAATENGWYQINMGETDAYVKQNYLTEIPWKINALGDSMTAGAVVHDKNNLYFNVVGILCGAQEARNYGSNGTTIAGIMPTNFVDRSMFMEKDANLVLVLGGTNDFYYNIPLGTDQDRTYFSFYGAMHMLCSRLKMVYPDSDIVFMTPLHRVDEFGEINQNGNTLEEYADVIMQVCSEYDIPVIDLYHEDRLNFGTNKELYMPDGLHPDDLGQMAIGYYVADKLKDMGIVYGDRPEVDMSLIMPQTVETTEMDGNQAVSETGESGVYQSVQDITEGNMP
ncbi:MAG: SH3 domain-containing protein [Lachnospiraceae bacterium]|nr:SH3 domain-containing protein [Lachnospiraceae bacterium]